MKQKTHIFIPDAVAMNATLDAGFSIGISADFFNHYFRYLFPLCSTWIKVPDRN